MGFLEDLAAAKEQPKQKSELVSVIVNGSLYGLVFYRADGDVWAETVSRHPARTESKIDLRYGYNFNAVVLEIGVTTARFIEDGTEHEFPRDPVEKGQESAPPKSAAWSGLVSNLSGAEIGRVTDAIWALNEWNPAQEIERAKKALAAGSRRKRS